METVMQANEWLDALYDSFCELAGHQLSFSRVNKEGHFDYLPDIIYGASLTLKGRDLSVCMCLATNVEGCHAVGERMLSALSKSDAILPDIDYADAFCELLNIISGSVIRKYFAEDDSLVLSVPVFVNDNLQMPKNSVINGLSLKADGIPFSFIIIMAGT
ncbi:MAG: chemotaxis protein CheX [Planctomycetes bacterium]|nr:chemotaxis protein CheX [Planctomycetota bacterium]